MSIDPADHHGNEYLCLDATPLIHFNNHGFLDSLGALTRNPTFSPEHVLDLEIREPMKRDTRYRKNHSILKAEWLFGAVLEDMQGIKRVADLKRRLGGSPLQNLGEAHAIALGERYGWTLVMDDEGGRLAAADPRDGTVVPTVYMVTLLAVGAGFGEIEPEDAWRIHKTIETERRRSIVLPEQRGVFMRSVELFGKLEGKVEPWPNVLARGRALDDLIVLERRKSA